jgi:hypothetical protein
MVRTLPVLIHIELGMVHMLEKGSARDTIMVKLALSPPPVTVITAAQKVRQEIRVPQNWMTDQTVQEPLQCAPSAFNEFLREATCGQGMNGVHVISQG